MSFVEELCMSDIWERLGHISLEEMSGVNLMNRIDTKYVTSRKMLLPMLEEAVTYGYSVQFNHQALYGYDTTYYDTDSLEMYLIPHNRKLHRLKVRCRTYLDSSISFLEIKDKSNKGRTNKIRIAVEQTDYNALKTNRDVNDFIGEHTKYNFQELAPSLETIFQRITLVNKQKTERITIDVDLHFVNSRNRCESSLSDLIIIELKQDGRFHSTMKSILQHLRIKPFHLSKYCIGIALTDPAIKANRFKRKIHLLNKFKNKIYE